MPFPTDWCILVMKFKTVAEKSRCKHFCCERVPPSWANTNGHNSNGLRTVEIWGMTFKNNRAPLLSIIKLYPSFHHHMWIQTGVTVRKRLSWVLTSVTLTFDLWPWPFAWTSLLSLVITPENFMMIRWWEHSQKGVTDRQTDRQTDGRKRPFIELLGRS